VNTGT
jgi:hypothetical protein